MWAGRRGNRRSAAGGGRSEPVSRKCPDWRPRQWTGIGWHDGGQSTTPTHSGMIFIKMSLRGAQRRGNPFPLCGAVRGGVRIATPACAPVRNDTGFWGCGAWRRRGEGTPPYRGGQGGAVQADRRGNRRSAAGGGGSEPISRKCPDWRPRQWTGIGWHDGGQSLPPTKTAMCLVPRRCGCGA